MDKIKSNIGSIIAMISGFLMIGAVKIWAPVCQKQLELFWKSGDVKFTNMKCYYTERVVIYLSVILIVMMIIAIIENTKPVVVPSIIAFFMYISTTKGNLGIGMCKTGIGMQCEGTRTWIYGVAVAILVSALINFFMKKRDKRK